MLIRAIISVDSF